MRIARVARAQRRGPVLPVRRGTRPNPDGPLREQEVNCCPYCGNDGVSEDDETSEGDVFLCTNCAGYFVMESGVFRQMTEADADALTMDELVEMATTKAAMLQWAAANNVPTAYTEEVLALQAERLPTIEE